MKVKYLLAIFLVFIFSLIFVGKTFAQSTLPLNTDSNVPQNLHTYTQSVFIELAAAASCQITGVDPINPDGKCLGLDEKTGKIGFIQNGGGLIGLLGNGIAMTFEIPVSSTHYAADLASNFGVAKKTYAANDGGVGFVGLTPLLRIWKVFRNLIYLLFVLIFVLIGLGIMFRIKIDPRTVMTIQNQIPKIIIALILVTFSYAIAGFLIDFMYVMMYLAFNIFAPLIGQTGTAVSLPAVGTLSQNLGNGTLNPVALQGSTPFSAIGFLGGVKMAAGASGGISNIIASLFDGTIGRILAGVIGGIIGAGAGSLFPGAGAFIGGGIGILGGALLGSKLFGIIGGIIAFMVFSAAILTSLFRLWFQLLKTYISILINIVLAPFWIAGGLIPSSPLSFSGWLKDMLGNLMSFPATLVMLLFAKLFMTTFGQGGSGSNNFVPPFIGNPGDTSAFGSLIGVGILMLTPNVVNMVRNAIKAPASGKFTAGLGQSVSIGAGFVTNPVKGVGHRLWGEDPYTRAPRPLTKAVRDRLSNLAGKRGPLAKIAGIAHKGITTLYPGERRDTTATTNSNALSGQIEQENAKSQGTNNGGATPPKTT